MANLTLAGIGLYYVLSLKTIFLVSLTLTLNGLGGREKGGGEGWVTRVGHHISMLGIHLFQAPNPYLNDPINDRTV